jgi:riboflavin kinase/FMN adenylyltransferase
MKFYHSLEDINLDNSPSVLTVGMFDGVHLGHLSVLQKVIQLSKESNIPSIVLTFSNHPSSYFQPTNLVGQISNLDEKINLLESLGIDIVIALPFDSYMASLSAQSFAENILIDKLNVREIVFGYDNHFGHNREGSKEFIDKRFPSIHTHRVEETKIDNEIVSSSLIKSYIQKGDVEKANQLLNYTYSLQGTVIKGDQLGRTIGFPTANINTQTYKLIPPIGVYFTRSYVDNQILYGMTNIGVRPTVTKSEELRIETHLLNFDQDIYGQTLRVEFIKRMRNEQKFDSFAALVNQLEKDKSEAQNLLAKIHVTP